MQQTLLHHTLLPAALEPELEARWMAALPAARAAAVARLRDRADRAATVLGLALLLDCARAAGLRPPQPASLEFPLAGKPRWPSGPDFSISHAGGRVACVLVPRGLRVGLDLEAVGSVAPRALRLVASAGELDEFAAAGLTPTDLWTAKEAVLKAAGAEFGAVSAIRVSATEASFRGVRYLLQRPDLGPDCSCTLALDGTIPIVVRPVAPQPVLGALDGYATESLQATQNPVPR